MPPATDREGRPTRFTRHALDQATKRGTTPEEMVAVLQTGTVDTARAGYSALSKVYPFVRAWRGRYYRQKTVGVVYVAEAGETVVITVYVYYGSWGQ